MLLQADVQGHPHEADNHEAGQPVPASDHCIPRKRPSGIGQGAAASAGQRPDSAPGPDSSSIMEPPTARSGNPIRPRR